MRLARSARLCAAARAGALPALAAALLWGGASGAEFPVSAQAGEERSADVASNGAVFLVVWQDDRNAASKPDIYAARLNAAGAILGSGPFPLTTATGSQASPRVASDGTDFLVVWVDAQGGALQLDIHGVTVDADGTVGTPFVISDGADRQDLPDVAWTGSQYLVAWQDERDSATTGWDVFAARVTAAGVLEDATGIKITAAETQDSPAVAGSGGNALVVFRHIESGENDIRGAVVDAAGAVAVAPFDIAAEASTQKSPGVAFATGVFLVAWEDYRASATHPDIYVARVTSAGAVLDASPHVAVAADTLRRSAEPSLALDGGSLLVAWEEGAQGDCDIRHARVVADATGCSVHRALAPWVYAGPADQSAAAVASWGQGALVVWSDDRNDPGASGDVFATLLATNDPPAADAGPDVIVRPGAEVRLDGSASLDPEMVSLAFAWSQVSGAGVALSGAETPRPGFTAPGSGGALVFELGVSDGVIVSEDRITVTVDGAAAPAPAASSIQAAALDSYSVKIKWNATPAARGSVLYGTTPALGSESPQGAAATASPEVTLAGLRAGATYYYAVRSEGDNCAWSLSGVGTFTLAAPPPSDDVDGDGIPNDWELIWFGADTAADAATDPDGDGLANLNEYRHGTGPWDHDTDGDGAPDGYEVGEGTNPLRSDSVPPPVVAAPPPQPVIYVLPRSDSGCSSGALSPACPADRGAGGASGAGGLLSGLLLGVFLLRALGRTSRPRRTG